MDPRARNFAIDFSNTLQYGTWEPRVYEYFSGDSLRPAKYIATRSQHASESFLIATRAPGLPRHLDNRAPYCSSPGSDVLDGAALAPHTSAPIVTISS